MNPAEITVTENNAGDKVAPAVEAGNTTATTTATTTAATTTAATTAAAAAAKGTNNDGTAIEASALSTTTPGTGATSTTKHVTIVEPTPPSNTAATNIGTGTVTVAATTTTTGNATPDTTQQSYIVQLQEDSKDQATQLVQAIEVAADTAQPPSSLPNILVSNRKFGGTIDYPPDNQRATWWQAGQPCMAVDGTAVILIICLGASQGVCYGLRVSRMNPPSIIEIPTTSLNLIPNKSPTNDAFKDKSLKSSNFLPGRKTGTKPAPRAVPIRLEMLPLLLDSHPPRYFVDLINNNSAPIDKESTMYNWFCAATAWDESNQAISTLQLRFSPCTELTSEYGATMLTDLEEAFEDEGAIGSLIRSCCISVPVQQQDPTASLHQTTTETATSLLVQQQTITQQTSQQQQQQQLQQQQLQQQLLLQQQQLQQQQQQQEQQKQQLQQQQLLLQQQQQQLLQKQQQQQQQNQTQGNYQPPPTLPQQQTQQGFLGAVDTGIQTGVLTTTAPTPGIAPGTQPLGMQQQQGFLGAVDTGMQTGVLTTTAPNPGMAPGTQPLGMQQHQGFIGHQVGMNTGMQAGLPATTPHHNMQPGMQPFGMQQGTLSGMPNNPNVMQTLGMQRGNFQNMSNHQGMPSLGMQQQGMQSTSFPQMQNPTQLGFPNQLQPDQSVMEMGKRFAQGMLSGASIPEGHISYMSHLLQLNSAYTTTTSTGSSTTNSPVAASLAQDKLHYLLGWSGCNNAQTAWPNNKQAWVDFVKLTTTNTKQDFIRIRFCGQLQSWFDEDMDVTKHPAFVKMMAELEFEPQLETETSKVSSGLSPLCFFDLVKGALLTALYQHRLNQQASVNTTSDIEKTKLGHRIIPQSPTELLTVLNRMIICLQFFFGNACMLLQEIQMIYRTLEQNKTKYAHGTAFQDGMCKTICNGISEGCVRFFRQRKTAWEIQNNMFATVSLASTRTSIEINHTNNETNYPIFMPTILQLPTPQFQQQQYQQQQYQQHQHNPQIITNNNKRQQEQDLNRRTRSRKDAKPTHATTIPTCWTGIVNKYKAEGINTPKTNDIRTQLKLETNAQLSQALGINENDCINYCIKGECYIPKCKRNHPPTISPKEAVLIPAYEAVLKNLKSKK